VNERYVDRIAQMTRWQNLTTATKYLLEKAAANYSCLEMERS
jgi:hypothetical protein